ncbi:MAG: hypothetical protein LBS53_15835 [Synergistaceae bacterium]|nr:hypothetical protein [Synergistaceae bacterium]
MSGSAYGYHVSQLGIHELLDNKLDANLVFTQAPFGGYRMFGDVCEGELIVHESILRGTFIGGQAFLTGMRALV